VLAVIRSALFNVAFYAWTILCVTALCWLLLVPKGLFLRAVRWYLRTIAFFERVILGLRYEVKGREYIPDGPVLIAAKHQSAWETLKLHLILDDPAIVLKQELVKIPFWGWFARRLNMIPIDRSAHTKALLSMANDARRKGAQQGRPLVIFPQGTRVAPGVRAPYRSGVVLLYEQLGFPVVPMALNSGMFWPRRRFVKQSGTITVEFLEPIPPGLSRQAFKRRLQSELEAATDRLVTAVGGPALDPASDPTARPATKTRACETETGARRDQDGL